MEFLAFGKYTWFVWSSVVLSFAVLGANVIMARRLLKSRIKMARRRLAAEEV